MSVQLRKSKLSTSFSASNASPFKVRGITKETTAMVGSTRQTFMVASFQVRVLEWACLATRQGPIVLNVVLIRPNITTVVKVEPVRKQIVLKLLR